MPGSEMESNRERDRELMTRFYQCCAASFGALERVWHRRLFGYFRRKGVPHEDAEDLALEALVHLFQTKERLSFDLKRPLEPFLFTIAFNLYKGWLRDKCREPKRVDLDDEYVLSIAAPEVKSNRRLDDLYECIQRLPEDQLEYIATCGKHGIGERSHNEIAEILGKWPAQITQLSQRTRAALLACMEKKGYRKSKP